jgi:hypothetical protein
VLANNAGHLGEHSVAGQHLATRLASVLDHQQLQQRHTTTDNTHA